MNIEKLKACIVYACNRGAQQLDPVKLNKVLWYSDAASFMEHGQSITAARYTRKPRGPVASYMRIAIEELVNDAVLTPGQRFDADRGLWLQEFTVNDDSLAATLSDPERAYLDNAFKRVCFDHTSNAVSARTHGEIWEIAQDSEEIPLFTMFAERLGQITKEHIDAAFAG